jgi:hypothetical protein
VNSRLSALRNVLVPVIALPFTVPAIVSISQTPGLDVSVAVIVPLPGKGTPPRSGAGPVSDQSKTSALAGSDAAASGSNPAIITTPHDLANFIRSLSLGSPGLRFTDAHASVQGSGALLHVALMTAATMGERLRPRLVWAARAAV